MRIHRVTYCLTCTCNVQHVLRHVFVINFRSKTVCETCNDDGDDPYFSSYAHFGIHEEMLKVRKLISDTTVFAKLTERTRNAAIFV